MILDLVQIFRARRDPARAARLAAGLVRGQAVERAFAPLLLARLALLGVTVVCGIAAALLIWGAAASHWTVALPAILPAVIGFAAVTVHRGLRRGQERVEALAAQMADRGVDAVMSRLDTAHEP